MIEFWFIPRQFRIVNMIFVDDLMFQMMLFVYYSMACEVIKNGIDYPWSIFWLNRAVISSYDTSNDVLMGFRSDLDQLQVTLEILKKHWIFMRGGTTRWDGLKKEKETLITTWERWWLSQKCLFQKKRNLQ